MNIEFLYAKLSANMIHFFGNPSLDEHKQVLYKYLSYKESSFSRFINSMEYLNSILPDKLIIDEIDRSQIIYSFCIGEYRMLPIVLNQLGYNVTILMEERIKNQQSDLFFSLDKYINGNKVSVHKLKLISSKEDNVIWKLKSDIKNGRKVVIFIDGNSGLNKNIRHLIPSSFFFQPVFLHQGLSYLSYVTKTIPLGVVMFYNDRFFYDILKHNVIFERDLFAEKLTIDIFSSLEELLKKTDISKWDTLEGIYKWLDLERLNLENFNNGESIFLDHANIKFNAFRYSSFCLGNEYFIFDKKQYLTYKIDKRDYKAYAKCIDL